VKKDEQRALALVTMAVENAPVHDRIWIEEAYASIYCATAQGMRQEADGIVARWRRMFARPAAQPADRMSGRELLPERQCANGETVAIQRGGKSDTVAVAPPPAQQPATEVMKGSAASLGFRSAGAETPAKK
jgi:hypothetical protein